MIEVSGAIDQIASPGEEVASFWPGDIFEIPYESGFGIRKPVWPPDFRKDSPPSSGPNIIFFHPTRSSLISLVTCREWSCCGTRSSRRRPINVTPMSGITGTAFDVRFSLMDTM